MRTYRLDNSGFTIVEVMIVAVVSAIVIFASSQATVIFVKSMKRSEKILEVGNETQDLVMYLSRSSKNLIMSRVDLPNTYLLRPNLPPVVVGPNSAEEPLTPSFSYNPQKWLAGGTGHPWRSRAEAVAPAGTSQTLSINSFLLEEHMLSQTGVDLKKLTKRLLISRCDAIDASNDTNISALPADAKPAITALYVIEGMKRRPFLTFDGNGGGNVNCCPISQPNCRAGFTDYFFKTFIITFGNTVDADGDQPVVQVEEFPKPTTDNAVLGMGFGLYFENTAGTNVSIRTFTLVNRCQILGNQSHPACRFPRTSLEQFMALVKQEPGIIRVDLRSISTVIGGNISKTGVISL